MCQTACCPPLQSERGSRCDTAHMDRNELKLVARDREPSIEQTVLDTPQSSGSSHRLFFISFFFFILAVTFFVAGTGGLFPDTLSRNDLGKRPKKGIAATRTFTFRPDSELLRKKSEEAARNVRAVYSSRNNGWLDIWHRQVNFAFRAIKDPIFREKEDLARLRFNELAGIAVDKVTFWSLSNSVGYDRLKSILQTLFKNVLKDQLLVRDIEALKAKHPGGIEVLVYSREGAGAVEKPTRRIIGSQYKEILDLNLLAARFNSEIETRYSLGDKDNLDRDAQKAIHTLCMALITAHLDSHKRASGLGIVFRPELTDQRREEVRRQVTAQPRAFNKGDVIVRAGEPITLESVKIFQTMVPSLSARIFGFLGDLFFIASFFLIIGWFATLKFGGRRGVIKDFFVSGLLFLLFLGMVKGAWYVINGLVKNPDPMLYPAVFPAAGAAFLIKVLMGNRFAVFFSIAISFMSTWAIGAPVSIAIFYFLTGLAAAGASDRVEHRYVIWKSGFMIIGINTFLILVLRVVSGELTQPATLWYLLAGAGGGVFLGVLMSALLPVVEYLGDYITDIKLLELTNTDHPLLQELNEKATGTYMHSQTVSQLAFSAAKKVGANALLVKVAAYYHDVGKTRQPRFFIENQAGENPHDKLKPSMSALVIRNHIKDTREILEKAGIPKLVIDIASSHHGSTLIEYFHNKAKAQAGPEEVVSDADYRYPGPIPQTREAGILMLADTVEAAVRSRVASIQTKPKDASKTQQFDMNTIKAVVQSIINKKFTDGQLDACELTLRDLSIIAGSFITTLSSIHHERVSYPGQGEKGNVPRRPSQAYPVIEKKPEGETPKEGRKAPPKPKAH